MPVVRGIRVLNAIATGNTTPSCLDTLLSDAGRLADVTQVLSSPQYSCALGQSNTASFTAVRSNNAMTALFGNPVGACIFYQTQTSRNNMLASSCYYNYMMGFGNQSATDAFTHLGNTPCMLNCAFSSCTAFLSSATSSNTEIAKMLSCNCNVRNCFIGTAQSKQEALGTPGRPAYWLSDGTAFGYLTCCMLDTAFANTVFLETLNRDIACVMCTPAFNCCAWGTVAGSNTYTNNACAINEVVNKGACCLNYTSCNFSCWYSSTYGVTCLTAQLASGNTYFIDQINALGSFRQRSCLYYLFECADLCYNSCICSNPTAGQAVNAIKLLKTEVVSRGGYSANNSNLPLSNYYHCYGQRICPMTIANGCQLSNTEVEYIGKFSKCNYNVITHADCRFTLISPGFWNQSSGIACFKNCYCCSLDRTTANTSGLTINCSLYYTTDNAATFNRLSYCIPACIFQQVCGNCCCQFTVRYGMSSFACCNYVYTGWIISDCGTGFGGCCTPAFFKTGHSRVCLFANSQPNTASWTHFPDVPLPFYTIAFCDEYFAGVSPMRTDGYQSTLGLCNQLCCQCPGQYALMFSFGKVGDCVRVSCDNFVNCQPTNVCCFTPTTCCQACRSLPAVTSYTFGTCMEDYFQGHGSGTGVYCMYSPHIPGFETSNYMTLRMGVNSAATSHTLIYKNPSDQTDSKAFLVGWRSYAMMYGGPIGPFGQCTCGVVGPARCGTYYYNCCNLRGTVEQLPYACGYFSSSAGVNVWCYGAQANNTMQGSEIACSVLGGTSSSWTNFTLSNAKIIGNKLVLAGSLPPKITLCCYYAHCDGCNSCYLAAGMSREQTGGYYGCQNAFGQVGHTTLLNTNGVVGSFICCLDSMYHQQPFADNAGFEPASYWCQYCSGRCGCCVDNCCNGTSSPGGLYMTMYPFISDIAGLKTINLYGSSNSIYSFAAFPNMPPMAACFKGGGADCSLVCCLTRYTSIAPTGAQPMRSDQSQYCAKDFGDACVYQFNDQASYYGRLGPQVDGFFYNCNPGFANTVGISFAQHIYSGCFSPKHFNGVYVPPSANQDTTLYNFCYVITPHRDLCLDGPFCWNGGCECFPSGATVPCSPCCPACNVMRCCVCGYDGRYGVACLFCIEQLVRCDGFDRQQLRVNCVGSQFPCCQTPLRYCCPSVGGCVGFGNHHYTTAAANNTFQCAMTLNDFPYQCGNHCQCFSCDGSCEGCNCYTRKSIADYSPTIRTCNQSGPNCMWYDYMESVNSGWCLNNWVQQVGAKVYWNTQYLMDIGLCCCRTARCCYGLAYSATDDTKKAGFKFLPTTCQCCLFNVDGVCYPIVYSRQTRGSGGFLNTQNSIHIAYFDLVPFRCTVSGGGGFYANGNACPSASGLTCCLMYVKQDTFFNVG